jgi:quinol monooxygenase YgiN
MTARRWEVSVRSSGFVARRQLIQGFCAMLVSAGLAPNARAQQTAVPGRVVRISRGSFPPEKYESVKLRLDASQKALIPAIRRLAGCLHYFAAIDRESSTMVNVSIWRSPAEAQQMQTLAPMQALAEEFTREGVRFERPVIDYETLWEVS